MNIFTKSLVYTLCRDTFARPEKLLKNISVEKALKNTLGIAASKIPLYSHLKVNQDAKNIFGELKKFPVIQKTDLLTRKEAFYPPPKPWFLVGKTSGTTGTPLEIFRDFRSTVLENAFKRRRWATCGFKRRMKRATMRGDIVVPISRDKPPFWFYNWLDNQLFISSRHLKPGNYKTIADKLEDFAPFILEAYPSTVYDLALYLQKQRRFLKIPYIYTGSEILYDHQRELIQNQFSGQILDCYGMAERVAFAGECLHGNLHINTDYSYVEILDDKNQPTQGYGFITGTTLHNHAMPLIRYKLSDITKWKKGNCPCGSPFPMIEKIRGKFEDTLYGGSGNAISPSVLTFAFKGLHHIKQSQVAQVSKNKWEIRIVPEEEFSSHEEFKLTENIKTMVDPHINIDIRIVKNIERTAAGKFRWVINEYTEKQS